MEIGLIITIAAVAALVAGAIWVIFIRSGYPKFKFKKWGYHNGVRVEVFAENEELLKYYDPVRVSQTANAAIKALEFFPDKFSEKMRKKLSDKFDSVAVIILTDANFQKYTKVLSVHSAAKYSQYQRRIYTGWTPICYVKESTITDMMERTGDEMANGAPMIHEWIHGICLTAFGGADAAHSEKFLWQGLMNRATTIFNRLEGK